MSDRHPKWVRVEPGTVIPAGQPYRVEYVDSAQAHEYPGHRNPKVANETAGPFEAWFVDSSWKPPLDLPTEPTWGIAVHQDCGNCVGRWRLSERGNYLRKPTGQTSEILVSGVLDFIPLTDEQVQRIEAAR